jgi:hypothetical protein
MSGLRWGILGNKLGCSFASDRQHLLDSTPARFTVDLVFKFVRLMAVGYVADCQRSMLPPQCMEGGRGKREREREREEISHRSRMGFLNILKT